MLKELGKGFACGLGIASGLTVAGLIGTAIIKKKVEKEMGASLADMMLGGTPKVSPKEDNKI